MAVPASYLASITAASGAGSAASKFYIDPHDYGARGDAVAILDAVVSADKWTVTSAQYTFKSSDKGKEIHLTNGWEVAGFITTIDSVKNGVATLTQRAPTSGTQAVLIGTDDTVAFETAFLVASKTMLTTQQLGQGADPQSWGPVAVGGTVKLRSGRGYLVRNTQERYDAGLTAAINIPRHCSLEGTGMGQSAIYLGFNNIGHGISNYITGAADEHISMADFSLYCSRANQPAACLDGIHFETGLNNYTNIDSYSVIKNIAVHQARRHGWYIKGRGECFFNGLWALNSNSAGFFIVDAQDFHFIACNAGANGWSGFQIEVAASSAFDNCKSFYNGASGGTDITKTANWYISDAGHSYRKGTCVFTGCEAQESRGSGWLIKGGLNQFIGCLSSDPKRSVIGSAPRPYPAVSWHLDGNASNNVFEGCYARPALGLDWGGSTENHYGGDGALYISYTDGGGNPVLKGPHGNKGSIYTLEPCNYDVAKVFGTGTTNGLNGCLTIDGDPLPTDIPSAPTISSIVHDAYSGAVLTFSRSSSNGGRAITDYTYEYKLNTETTWTKINHFPSLATTYTMNGLTDNATYNFRVAAKNNNGYSNYSTVYNYTHSVGVPYQVGIVSAYVDSTKVHLYWTAPFDAGFAITDYKIEYKLTSSSTWIVFADGVSTSTTNVQLTGLTDGSSYDIRVSAINVNGTGAPSATVTVTPLAIMSNPFDTTLLGYYDATVTTSVVDGGNSTVESVVDLMNRSSNNLTQTTEAWKPTKGTATVGTGSALAFSGTSQMLSLPSNVVSALPNGDFTAMLAFKVNAGGLTQTNALYADDTATFILYLRGDLGDIVARCGGTAGSIKTVALDTNPHFIVVRRSGSSIAFFLDGVSSVSAAASDVASASINLGSVNQYYGTLNGAIGACAFYDSALTNAKINTILTQWNTEFGTSISLLP